jgi:hypothetical protein
VATGVRGTPATQCASGQPWWQSSPPAPPSQEVAVDSCAVYNSEHGDPYPNQQGIVVRPGDGSHQAACAGVASPAQCPLGGIVVNNSPTCIGVPNPDTCDDLSPGPGWAVGAEGECLAAPWVAVYPLYPGCPPAATFGAVVYGPNGAVVLRVCF